MSVYIDKTNNKILALSGSKFMTMEEKDLWHCCCCDWWCDDEHLSYPGSVDLFARFPSTPCPDGFIPYPNGVVCLGPFDVDVQVNHVTNCEAYYDDAFQAGVLDYSKCDRPRGYSWTGFFGPNDGSELVTDMGVLSAGNTFVFTIASQHATLVGLLFPDPGEYARVEWEAV